MTRDALVSAQHWRRRFVLQRALCVGVGVGLGCTVPRSPLAASVKLDKGAVQYTENGAVPDQDCDDCIQFVAGKTAKDSGMCRIVDGPISPHGHCIAFAPKPHR